ncbi:hypothetical protein SteCoe_32720 [Stentor coeruleus]|uniref:TOG domain-containing protein n=1 Tax=Stentor coeruleus TaxID=5963 RepID=A0A1R2AYF7_9CILI|nr:hypothetical protein SteCoe_32720 [Stentor coeruleus]
MEPSALDLFKEEMSSDETYIKVNCIHRLRTIATVMGPDAVRTQLLPFLSSLLHEEEEVLFALAEALGSIFPFFQNNPASLLSSLETLAALDETVVREQAVKTLNSISSSLSDADVSNLLIPIVLKLANAENFSARISACSLFTAAYPRAGALKEKLRSKFFELSHEDTPMVRRAAVIEVGRFAKVIEKNFVLSDVITDFKQLAQDEQEQVRILCLDSLIDAAKLLTKDENKLHVLPIVLILGDDKSWKVRYHFAIKYHALAEALGKDINESSLVQIIVQLLKDNEADVKCAALKSVQTSYSVFTKERIQSLLIPAIDAIVQDASLPPKVKNNCAEAISEMASYVGKDTASSRLTPMVMSLINDENYEVKLSMIKGLHKLAEVIGAEIISPNLCGILSTLSKDVPQWRIRESVIIACVDITKFLGDEIFTRSLQDIFFNFLTDTVSEVRLTGIIKLGELVRILGDDWVNAELYPKLQDIYHQKNSVIRITVLHALAKLNLTVDQLSTMVYFAAKDNVANVRLVLCKVMKEIGAKNDISTLKNVLQELCKDTDKDVRYFALAALR